MPPSFMQESVTSLLCVKSSKLKYRYGCRLSAGRIAAFFGLAAALFFVAIFPGNINQYVEGIDAFGLDTDEARLTRLFFQPLLVVWALWSTSAISVIRKLLSRPK